MKEEKRDDMLAFGGHMVDLRRLVTDAKDCKGGQLRPSTA